MTQAEGIGCQDGGERLGVRVRPHFAVALQSGDDPDADPRKRPGGCGRHGCTPGTPCVSSEVLTAAACCYFKVRQSAITVDPRSGAGEGSVLLNSLSRFNRRGRRVSKEANASGVSIQEVVVTAPGEEHRSADAASVGCGIGRTRARALP